jgi:hypothetical protein
VRKKWNRQDAKCAKEVGKKKLGELAKVRNRVGFVVFSG